MGKDNTENRGNVSASLVCANMTSMDKIGDLHCILLFLSTILTYSSSSYHFGPNKRRGPTSRMLQVCTL
jgi:hypothetical protein